MENKKESISKRDQEYVKTSRKEIALNRAFEINNDRNIQILSTVGAKPKSTKINLSTMLKDAEIIYKWLNK